MALFVWNDSYRVNVRTIDDQHRKLVGFINQFHEAIKKGQGEEVLAKILAELMDYAGYHFRNEEALMDTHAYPGRHQHMGGHNDFYEKVEAFERRRDAEGAQVADELARYLRNWLAEHIQGTDKQLGAFLNTRGVR